ncbi:hypothetical protein ABBQ38_014976 [Trebouxia sp. C0009 RCD-2024]
MERAHVDAFQIDQSSDLQRHLKAPMHIMQVVATMGPRNCGSSAEAAADNPKIVKHKAAAVSLVVCASATTVIRRYRPSKALPTTAYSAFPHPAYPFSPWKQLWSYCAGTSSSGSSMLRSPVSRSLPSLQRLL